MKDPALLEEYQRVDRYSVCPVCGKDSWCLISKDGEGVICARQPSDEGRGDAGWFHDISFDSEGLKEKERPEAITIKEATYRAQSAYLRMTPYDWVQAAGQIGVPTRSLRKLKVGRYKELWTFPMRDAARNVIGVRFRTSAGKKWSMKGSQNGLFLDPHASHADVVVEGPTDVAACLALGIQAVGKPQANGGDARTIDYLVSVNSVRVPVIGDNDMVGRSGALALANQLPGSFVLVPTKDKDVRDYYRRDPKGRALLRALQTHKSNSEWTVL